MGVETALLFCAIRAHEMLGTLSFTRDTRAGYEMALLCERLATDYLPVSAFRALRERSRAYA